MGLIFKPFKLLVFCLAVFGVLHIKVQDKTVLTHMDDWLQNKKQELSEQFPKKIKQTKAIISKHVRETKAQVSKALSSDESN